MGYLSMMEAKLPPGFRFHPRDEELVCDYLAKKVAASGSGDSETPVIVEVDLNKIEPWDLPEVACVGGKEWYFFSLRDRKYATGLRTNRATLSGYWKATGKDRPVIDVRKGMLVGMRKTLVFYQGRAPKGKKTDWVMHEYRMEGSLASTKHSFKDDWVLCRVFFKNRVGGKSNQENSYDDETGSSSPPPLMEPSLSFHQTALNLDNIEQVSCFSNFSHDNVSQQEEQAFLHPPNVGEEMPTTSCLPLLGAFPEMGPCTDLFSYDKRAIRAVLDHFVSLDSSKKVLPSSYEGDIADCYFPPMELPYIWNQY